LKCTSVITFAIKFVGRENVERRNWQMCSFAGVYAYFVVAAGERCREQQNRKLDKHSPEEKGEG